MKTITGRRGLLSLTGAATVVFVCAATMATVETTDGPRAATAAEADDSQPDAPAAANPSEESTVTVGDVRVGVDPKTGELRPLTAAESARLAREMNRIFKPRELTRKQNPDGSLSAVVAPNVLRFSVVRIGADGTASLGCAPGERAALDFMTGAQQAPTTGPEEK